MQIQTLVPDIYRTIKEKDEHFLPKLQSSLQVNLAPTLAEGLASERKAPTLRLSQMGPRCPKALWHSIHTPEEAESLPPWAEIKYAYGHIIEALALALAKAAGHEVTGEQDELVLDGIQGHRDAVIDGCVVDVKSTSSFGYNKFKDGTIAQDDPFGYLCQLDGYLLASADDPLVRVKDRGYLLAVDKTLGHMCIYEHKLRKDYIRERIRESIEIVERKQPPQCQCGVVPDGKSGNMRLDTRASYSAFKHCCFPNLRTFIYAEGPRYLTKVVRKPDVKEVDKFGKIVYN